MKSTYVPKAGRIMKADNLILSLRNWQFNGIWAVSFILIVQVAILKIIDVPNPMR